MNKFIIFTMEYQVATIALIILTLFNTKTQTSAQITYSATDRNDTGGGERPVKLNFSLNESTTPACYLKSLDPFMNRKVEDMVNLKVKLMEYELTFPNYTLNPLLIDNNWSYNPAKWARVSKQHGQTLLSLAFNYGLLSLMTLTLGTEKLVAELEDVPPGCMLMVDEETKIEAVVYLLMRDYKDYDVLAGTEANQVTMVEDERVCHEMIKITGSWGKFTDRCCKIDRITQQMVCEIDIENIWLSILYTMLASVRFILLFFGPLLLMPGVESLAKQTVPYIVKLKTPLVKTIYLCRAGTPKMAYKKVLDLRMIRRFPKFKEAVADLPIGEPIKVKVKQYSLLVNYSRLLSENNVPVGLTHSILRNLVQCKIKEIGPFRKCCHTNICRSLNTEARCLWITLFKNIARTFVILILIPLPFYLRLIVYYLYEYDEVVGRQNMLKRLDLKKTYDGSLVHYLGPLHPFFISIYCIYFFTVLVLAFMPKKGKGRLRRIAVGAFRDLKTMDWVMVVKMLVLNTIWPFQRFGILGCLLAPIYWPIVLPITLIVCLFYCLPSIYLTFRLLFYTSRPGAVLGSVKEKVKVGDYRVQQNKDETLGGLEANTLIEKVKKEKKKKEEQDETDGFQKREAKQINYRKFWFHLFAALLCILTMYAALFILSECVGLAVEVAVFTMMGLIVNAGSVLKVCILLILTVMYSYDCYNNVQKKYLKLNKSLFGEVKGRIKDLWDVTGLPSYLQENRGFKSQELDEQADHEEPDDIMENPPMNWKVNDLVLFIDSEDMPRIPKELFDQVCEIRVAGAPGPVYRSLIEATKEFLTIVLFLLFVFIVVMSFGSIYKVSSTNQVMATMAGGFLPFLMKTFLVPSKPDIEIGTVSFKSKMDEIVQNFYQNWPMFDFPFELWTEEDEKEAQAKEREKNKDDDADSNIDTFDRSAQTGMFDKAVQTNMQNGVKSKMTLNVETTSNNTNNNAGDESTNVTLETEQLVMNGEVKEEEVEETVDILIYLPTEKQEGWLQEWSDIDEYGQEHDDDLPVDEEELEEMENEAEGDIV